MPQPGLSRLLRAALVACAVSALGGCPGAETPESTGRRGSAADATAPVPEPTRSDGGSGAPDGPPAAQPEPAPEPEPTPAPAPEPAPEEVSAELAAAKPEAPAIPARPAHAPVVAHGPGAAASDPEARHRARAAAVAPTMSAADRVALVEAALTEAGTAADDVEPERAGGGDGRGTIGLARPGVIGYGAGRPAAAIDPAPGPGERASAMDPVPGALGLSPSIQLFTFRADPDRGLAAHPVQCRPERILETVTAVINRAAGPCEAQRNLLAQAGIELAYVTCSLVDSVPGCRRTYIGTLWVERTPGTFHDYQLQGFGRIARQCGARTERLAGPVDRRVARHGEALGKLFDICGDRLTMGATSSSASTSDGVPPP